MTLPVISAQVARRASSFWAALALFLSVSGLSCRTVPMLGPVDLSAPGWRVRQGQAIWKPTRRRPELVGELLLATRGNGDYFVQFSKNPFAIATAQRRDDVWQIEFGQGERRWTGEGAPPSRFGWFEIPRAVVGAGVDAGWTSRNPEPGRWLLENRATGERIEGYLSP